MHRAVALLVLFVFAATSEGAVLCRTTPGSIAAGSHGCCGDQAASPASVTTCCAASRPDGERHPVDLRTSGIPPVVMDPLVASVGSHEPGVSSPSQQPQPSNRSVPIYLQHLSLLI